MAKSVTSESGTACLAYYQVSETHNFFHSLTRFSTVGSYGDLNPACSASDRQGSNFKCLDGSAITFVSLYLGEALPNGQKKYFENFFQLR